MYFCIISLNIYRFIIISNWISQKGVRESQAVGYPSILDQTLFEQALIIITDKLKHRAKKGSGNARLHPVIHGDDHRQ